MYLFLLSPWWEGRGASHASERREERAEERLLPPFPFTSGRLRREERERDIVALRDAVHRTKTGNLP